MKPLKLDDIKQWLIDNRNEYQKLKSQEFPPLNNEVYWMYIRLHRFMEYYPFRHKCEESLKDLEISLNGNFFELVKWTKNNEILGSQELLMFEIDYFDWIEDVDEHLMKIHEGLYTERQPFNSILCFCKIFQLLFWDANIHETILKEHECRLPLFSTYLK
jgi:hypothetical protein